jgi:hypothetical protein
MRSSGEFFGLAAKRDPQRPVPPSTLWVADPRRHRFFAALQDVAEILRVPDYPLGALRAFLPPFFRPRGISSHCCGHQNHRSGILCLRVARLPP